MNHSFIDQHSHIDSVLSRLDPRVKIVSFMVLMVFIALAEPGCGLCLALYAMMTAGLIAFSRLPLLYIVLRSGVVLPFILLTSVFVLLSKPGNPVYQLSIGPFYFSISAAGWLLFQSVIIKGMLCVLSLILLTATTPFPQLLAAMESLKVPRLMTMILSFMYRYIFLIEDEAMKMRRAMQARSTGGSKRLRVKALANMIGVLFIRSFERGETVYLAMRSRGFDGTMRRTYAFCVKKADWIFLANMIALLIGIQLLDGYLGK
jgi:cobalt/nickel transport system permease protein